MKITLRFLFLFLLASISSISVNASCSAPKTITSAKDGNWNSSSTWMGGVVPDICDFVIINHNVNLNISINVGQNNTGGITINVDRSLYGNGTISIQGGGNYNLTNNGNLDIKGLNMYSGRNGARFTNNGKATIGSAISPDAYSIIQNSGSLIIDGNVTMQGSTILNLNGATLTITGILNLRNNSIQSTVDNYGYLEVQSNHSTQAFYLESGSLYNRPTGIIHVDKGGLYQAGPSSPLNYLYNENVIYSNYMDIHDNAYFENLDSVIITTDFHNNAITLNNGMASYLFVGRDFYNDSKNNTVFTNNGGFVEIVRNFQNDRLITGTGGGFSIKGNTINNVNGTISGSVDICDKSASPNYVDNNLGYISKTVTDCKYVAPCSSAIPAAISGNAFPCGASAGLVYSISAVSGATNYQWSVPSGYSITSGQGTTSITVTTGNSSGIIKVVVTKACGSGSVNKYITISSGTPSQPGTINLPPSTLCQTASGYVYTIKPVSSATSYVWTVPKDWTIDFGQGTTTVSVTAGTAAGNITVVASSACGTSAATSIAVSSSVVPNTPDVITMTSNGNNVLNGAVCSGQGFTAGVSSVTGATEYIWNFPSGWSVNNPGSGNACSLCSNSVSGNTSSSGTITVAASNACGVSSSITKSITMVNGSVPATPSISGPSKPEEGTSVQYTATTSNATGFNWSLPSGWSITSGAGSSTITVKVGKVGQSGTISAVATSFCNGGTNGSGTLAVSPSAPLPVKLIRFEAVRENEYALLKWSTALELNNDYFEVQRSLNGIDYIKIGEVKGSGTVNSIREYRFNDLTYSDLLGAQVYYRLKQVDFNGDFDISPVVFLTINKSSINTLGKVYPMPCVNEINFEINSDRPGDLKLVIADINGKVCHQQQFEVLRGFNLLSSIIPQTMPIGVYFVQITVNDKVERLRIVKAN